VFQAFKAYTNDFGKVFMKANKISSEFIIKDAVRKTNSWKILTDFSRFSSLCKNVDAISISGKTPDEQISEWDVTFDGAPLSWIQKDVFDDALFSVGFKAISGDFEEFSGRLCLQNAPDKGIVLAYSARYNLGIPIIEDLFGPVFQQKMQENFDVIVAGVAGEVGRCANETDERKVHRYKIGVREALILDGARVDAKIEDISVLGMLFSCENSLDKPVAMQACGLESNVRELQYESFDKKYRLIFERQLDEEQLLKVVKTLQGRHVRTLGDLLVKESEAVAYS
jgi:ribosome-associated toxin RatA of RatAB toxin-antitoxin module